MPITIKQLAEDDVNFYPLTHASGVVFADGTYLSNKTFGETNVIETVKVNGSTQTITNKAVDITVPTKTSDLTNDSGFVTSAVSGVKGNSESTYRTGNVNLTAANIGAATSSHTHGNITNAGALQTTDITIASGDKLVVTDSSNSNKVARTSVSFDGSTTTTALTPKGTFETFLKTAPVTSVNGNTGAVTISVPTKVSDLTNDSGFTSNTGTITGITMNGSSKGTSGVVNLGTVITAHQDISGKENTSNKVTSISSSSTDTQYPSAKAVYDTINNKKSYSTSHVWGTETTWVLGVGVSDNSYAISKNTYNISECETVDFIRFNTHTFSGNSYSKDFIISPYKNPDTSTNQTYISFSWSSNTVNFRITVNGVDIINQSYTCNWMTARTGFRMSPQSKLITWFKRPSSGATADSSYTTLDISSVDMSVFTNCYLMVGIGDSQTTVANYHVSLNDLCSFYDLIAIQMPYGGYSSYLSNLSDVNVSNNTFNSSIMSAYSWTLLNNGHYQQSIPTTTNSLAVKFSGNFNERTYSKVKLKSGVNITITSSYFISMIDSEGIIEAGSATSGESKSYTLSANEEYTVVVLGSYFDFSCSSGGSSGSAYVIDVYDYSAIVTKHTNLTPVNYDGSIIFGSIEFEYNQYNNVEILPLYRIEAQTNQGILGSILQNTTTGYVYIICISNGQIVSKQINIA